MLLEIIKTMEFYIAWE